MHHMTPASIRRATLHLLMLPLIALTVGCGAVGWFAQGVAGGERTYQVDAQYLGLQNRKTAVMVAADEYTLFQAPGSPLRVSRAVSARIAENVPGAQLVTPQDVIEFQRDNPYWSAVPYSDLIAKLGVERLVVIDLIEYRTHEPGNPHILQGMITGQVGVVEADSEDPDRPVFATTVRAQFPADSAIGLVNSDVETVELGMLVTFARDAAGLFYDHEVVK